MAVMTSASLPLSKMSLIRALWVSLAWGGSGPQDLEVLLAVQDAIEAVVQTRAPACPLWPARGRVQRRNDAEGRQRLEAFAVQLVDQLQVFVVQRVVRRADAERVQRQVALVVAGALLGELVAQRRVDVDELVAALARSGLDVVAGSAASTAVMSAGWVALVKAR